MVETLAGRTNVSNAHFPNASLPIIFSFGENVMFFNHYPQLKGIKEAGQFAQDNIVNFMQNTT